MRAIKNLFHLLQAIVANVIFGFPSRRLKVIAITGTDGKTTTSTMIYHFLKSAGYKVALISTVAAYIGDDEIDTGFHVTTPNPFQLQQLLRRIVDASIDYLVLEVTSHGIDQNRIWGVSPTYAAITNITHEHFDYHRTYEQYVATKTRLLLNAKHIFLNQDAKDSFQRVRTILSNRSIDFHAVSIQHFTIQQKSALTARFGAQQYNFENSALAVAIASEIGVSEKAILKSIRTFPGIPGRMQEIIRSRGVRCIVDFAHTPAALKQVIQAVGALKKSGKLILVFGCAGLRDSTKRPMMGEIAARLADLVVLTAEDPRTEDVWSIIAEIKSGVPKKAHGKIVSIPDRHEAIAFAYNTLAQSGDILLVTGKGHEKSMCIGEVEYPWSDAESILKITSNL